MDAWVIALISAGSAVVGSGVTGWFTRNAGDRQAEAARYAGSRQADALLETVRMTLEEQRAERVLDSRRRTYLDFLAAADAILTAGRGGDGARDSRAALVRAIGAVQLEGPPAVTKTAESLIAHLLGDTGRSPDDRDQARKAFLEAARAALQDSVEENGRI